MSTTLVGVFDDMNDALEARDKLRASGIDEDAMRIEAESAASVRSRTGGGGGRAVEGAAFDETTGGATGATRATDAIGTSGTTVSPFAESAGTGLPTEPGTTSRRGFFAEFFGLGDDDQTPDHYAEAVRRGGTVLIVDVADDDRIADVVERLENCGAIDIDERVQQWRAAGYSGHDVAAPPYTPQQVEAERGQQQVLNVVEEDLRVGKRTVERGRVRVHRRITETPVEETVTLREQRAVVDRQSVDRPATAADLAAFDEPNSRATIELRESAEEAVVAKTARVVEEVRVGTSSSERTETVRDTVRRSDVAIERIEGDADDGATGIRFGAAANTVSSDLGVHRSALDPSDALLTTGTADGTGSIGLPSAVADAAYGVGGAWRGYTGPERRMPGGSSGVYSGVERRAA